MRVLHLTRMKSLNSSPRFGKLWLVSHRWQNLPSTSRLELVPADTAAPRWDRRCYDPGMNWAQLVSARDW